MGSMWVTMVRNRCPYCEQGTLFSGWLTLRETCEVCGARYGRQPGVWIGPTVAGYGIGGVIGIVGGFILITRDVEIPNAEIVLALIACLAVIASFRFLKAGWVGWLYDSGYVYPDEEKKESL